ncbi:MAG: DUF6273 domain-containing protein [Actinomycetes bacterium]|jgi:Tfp pilus assembly protein PilV|nr:DUF6273 domain-containing protein [Actinomycetes bacterium]
MNENRWLVILLVLAVSISGVAGAAVIKEKREAKATQLAAQQQAARDAAQAAADEAAAAAAATEAPAAVAALPTAEETTTASTATSTTTDTGTTSTTSGTTTTTNSSTSSGSSSTTSTKKKTTNKKTTTTVPALAQGNTVTYGTWLGESLTWRVIDIRTNDVLLVTDRVISAGSFNSDTTALTPADYATSDISAWLTGTFAPQVFTADEQATLVTRLPDTGGVFLLTAEEANRYLDGTAARQAKALGAAQLIAGYSGEPLTVLGGKASWWLSTADPTDPRRAYSVNTDGDIVATDVTDPGIGLRPAIKLQRSKVTFTPDTGSKTAFTAAVK